MSTSTFDSLLRALCNVCYAQLWENQTNLERKCALSAQSHI